jgi:hypothetical protein
LPPSAAGSNRRAQRHRLPDGEFLFNLPVFDPHILVLLDARFAPLRFHLAKVCFHDGNAPILNSCRHSRRI